MLHVCVYVLFVADFRTSYIWHSNSTIKRVFITFNTNNSLYLPITTLWANSADEKLMALFLFLIFPRKQDLTFHEICLLRAPTKGIWSMSTQVQYDCNLRISKTYNVWIGLIRTFTCRSCNISPHIHWRHLFRGASHFAQISVQGRWWHKMVLLPACFSSYGQLIIH